MKKQKLRYEDPPKTGEFHIIHEKCLRGIIRNDWSFVDRRYEKWVREDTYASNMYLRPAFFMELRTRLEYDVEDDFYYCKTWPIVVKPSKVVAEACRAEGARFITVWRERAIPRYASSVGELTDYLDSLFDE